MLSRRDALLNTFRWVASSVATMACALVADRAQATIPRGPVLEERLLVGLRVKTQSDKEFIAKIVALVEQGVLPVSLVDSTYFWARGKASKNLRLQNNPMVYFRPGLVARAARLGIKL
ncbi:hypothetical protein [Aeoliella mucimassa]|uniref:Uncharacterized protein n=1 Tax=Aeoliella mucimassa TaxID=2527972 RepID=A0A518ATV7_9BACT|nr:hypothetical protein [Aeoliella mucimassa]QDU58160.1 hypothetical protein Pan181_43870 [Aeoliella mucimassa]